MGARQSTAEETARAERGRVVDLKSSGDSISSELERVFGRALAIGDPTERDRFLDQIGHETPDLVTEVRELLDNHEKDDLGLDRLAAEMASGILEELDHAGKPNRLSVGPFELGETLGRGGMGVVYRARRTGSEFDQEVAVKILHLDMDSPTARVRFQREQQLLASLRHRHIAGLIDGGVTPEDRPYLVMEIVEGLPVDHWCEQRDLGVRERIRLFLQVVDAVAYLHRNLVVHRDLKPRNILVDTNGDAKLLDFGIAKLLDEADDNTRTVDRMLTPSYAAPEQLRGDAPTTAIDVFALGLVLSELLGKPHHATDERPRPQTNAPARRPLPADLRRICSKATQDEPDMRYTTADELGQDLRRFLDGRPVTATPPTWRYLVLKMLARHRRAVAAGALVLALMAAFAARESRLRSAAESAQRQAQTEAGKARAVAGFLSEILSAPDPWGEHGREVAVVDVLEAAALQLDGEHRFEAEPLIEAEVRSTVGRAYTALEKPEDAEPHLRRALELLHNHGAGSSELSKAQEDLAANFYRARDFEAAEPLFADLLEERRSRLGDEHPDTLAILHQLANTAYWLGDLERVEQLDRRTLKIRRRVLGPGHPDTIRSINGLGATLFSQSRIPEAAELFEEAFTLQTQHLGADHADTQMTATNLGAAWLELGRYREGESLLRSALEVQLEIFGPDNSQTAFTLQNLGLILTGLDQFEAALEMLSEAVRIRQDLSGTDFLRLGCQAQVGDVLIELGRLDEAEALYQQTLRGLGELTGEAARDEIWRTEIRLAELERRRGRLDAADRRLARLQPEAFEQLGDDPAVVKARLVEARLRRDQKRPLDSYHVAQSALAKSEQRQPGDLPQTVEARFELVQALIELRRFDEARPLAESILTIRSSRYGADHLATQEIEKLLADWPESPAS